MMFYIFAVIWMLFAAAVAGFLFLASTPLGFYLRYKVWPELSVRQYTPLSNNNDAKEA